MEHPQRVRDIIRSFPEKKVGNPPVSETPPCLRTLGARLRGRTATQCSKKGSGKGSGEGFWGRVLGRGPFSVGFTVKKGSEKGSQKRL